MPELRPELDAELTAMREVDTALQKVDVEVRARVLRWACEKNHVDAAPLGGQRDA